MELSPEWAAIGMHRGITSARIGARVKIDLRLSIIIQVGDRRFGISQPFAKPTWARHKCRRKYRIAGRATSNPIDGIKHLDEVVDAVTVYIPHCRDAPAERHGRFFGKHAFPPPEHFTGVAAQEAAFA